uniref:Sema domain-containing protein n=1 Tax=Denticeps clupeoides TaxID=299321 RepID=A0AAY4E9B4_9TELE
MSFLLAVLFLLGAPVVLGFSLVPRKTVLQPNVQLRLFQEDGFWNYSTMLLREDLGVLIVGAREAIYALDVGDISVKKSAVRWHVKPQKQTECTYKGKHMDVECRNYIRTLHKINATSMYVCGTNAFSPTCDYMTYTDGQLKLMQEQEEGKGKCPFDPFQRYSSVMVGADLYTATSLNFLGSEPAVLRSSSTVLRSDFKSSWLNEPQFIYMDLVPESEESPDGDDDKVYLFFSEVAVEYDYDSKLMVSRVARVCKGDMGGQRTLQRKWTSFLKARLDCPVPELSLPYVVQDVFLLRRPNWRESLFYAVFTPQSGSTDLSAVCAYSMAAIGRAFGGKYKTPVDVESSHVKWVTYSGEVPVPRPGACVDDGARRLGMRSSRNLPDSTLQFVRDRPLMDEAVHPVTGGPLLLKRGTLLTRVVVDSVLALDGHRHAVMFAATEDGFIQKAVNYDKEMFVIEEVQLFQTPEPIKTLRLSTGRDNDSESERRKRFPLSRPSVSEARGHQPGGRNQRASGLPLRLQPGAGPLAPGREAAAGVRAEVLPPPRRHPGPQRVGGGRRGLRLRAAGAGGRRRVPPHPGRVPAAARSGRGTGTRRGEGAHRPAHAAARRAAAAGGGRPRDGAAGVRGRPPRPAARRAALARLQEARRPEGLGTAARLRRAAGRRGAFAGEEAGAQHELQQQPRLLQQERGVPRPVHGHFQRSGRVGDLTCPHQTTAFANFIFLFIPL